MLTFEECQEMLTEIADGLPPAIFQGLNGGILLLPDTVPHPEKVTGNLYILGQYRYEPTGFGRYVVIYYGSFCLAHGNLSHDGQRRKLAELLHHELTHHLEHLAGDRSLEIQDAVDIARYQENHRNLAPRDHNPQP